MEHTFQLESTFELMDGTCFQEIYECDGFTYSENTPKLIQNTNHEYMCLDGTQLVYQARTRSRIADDCRFILHTYKGTTSDIGRPVMLQIRLGEKNFTVCCGQQDTIVYVREDYPVPDSFEDRHHEALFFLKEIIGRDDLKCLESGRWPAYYMSFNDPYSDSVSNDQDIDLSGTFMGDPTISVLPPCPTVGPVVEKQVSPHLETPTESMGTQKELNSAQEADTTLEECFALAVKKADLADHPVAMYSLSSSQEVMKVCYDEKARDQTLQENSSESTGFRSLQSTEQSKSHRLF